MSINKHAIEKTILDAAQALLAEVGESFTMEQLEAQTHISRATIYRRVGPKETLLKRLAKERGETFEKVDVRSSILQAARVVFGREGLVAATIEQIAVEANVGVATIYRHFGAKEGLMLAFIEEMTHRAAVRNLTLHPSEDIAADLENIVRVIVTFFFENRDMLRLVFMGNEAERHYLNSLRTQSNSTLAHLTDYFQAQLTAGRLARVGEPSELALALIGMTIAFTIIGPLHYGTKFEHPEQSSRFIVTLFLNDQRETL